MPNFAPIVLVVSLLVTTVAAAEIDSSVPTETFKPLGIFPYPNDHPFIKIVTKKSLSRLLFEDTTPQVLLLYEKNDPLVNTLSKTFEEFAIALFPIIRLLSLDCASDSGKELLKNYGIEGSNSMILMFNSDMNPVNDGEMMIKMPISYEGDGSLDHLVRWALRTLSNMPIDFVNDDHTMALFLNYMSHAKMPKILFMSNETAIPPVFKSIAQQFRFGCRSAVAVASESPELVARYNITEFPVLLGFIPQGNNDFTVTKMGTPKLHTWEEDPNGASVFNMIKAFYDGLAIPENIRSELTFQIIMEEQSYIRKAQDQEKFASVLEPLLVSDRATWTSKCLNLKAGVCLVIFRDISDILQTMADKDKEGNDFEMMRNITRRALVRSQMPLQAVLVDGLTNYKLVQAFGINNGIPDAVAIYPQRKTYYNFVGALNEKNLVNLILDKVHRNKQPREFPKEIPEFLKSNTDERSATEEMISEEL